VGTRVVRTRDARAGATPGASRPEGPNSPQAAAYLGDIAHAQVDGPNADGLGIVATSKKRLSDCDGGHYFSSLHTGATAWYLLALQADNPFHVILPPS
jgi:hypothetical protein